MGARQIDLKEVPGIDVVISRLSSIDPGLTIAAAAYDFDRTSYVLVLNGQGREGCVTLSWELLDDVRDNRTRHGKPVHAGTIPCPVGLNESSFQCYCDSCYDLQRRQRRH
jgi:hypothetical protein